MNKVFARLRLVVLENPSLSWGHPLTESLCGKIIGLKLRGYGEYFPREVLAVDSTDFIADHLLICREEFNGDLYPIFGSKLISFESCLRYGLDFPALSIPQKANAHPHASVVEEIINHAQDNQKDLRYLASLTREPSERRGYDWSQALRDLHTTLYVNFTRSLSPCEVFAGGTISCHMDDYVYSLGHQDLTIDGKKLSAIGVPHLKNEKVMWTHLTNFSPEALAIAQANSSMWEERIHIRVKDVEKAFPSAA